MVCIIAWSLCICYAQTGAEYLIITHDDYVDALQPLVIWKEQIGLKTHLAKLSEIGSDSAQIRAYVVNAYNTWVPRPKYLLLVGSGSQIPFPRMTQHIEVCESDNYYTNVTGDFRNEIIPGRFWTDSVIQVKTIVAKTLCYEREPWILGDPWYKKGVTVVGEDGTQSDSVYWADARYAHALMLSAGYIHIDSLSDSLGHDTLDLLSAINEGRSVILYRGLGGVVWSPPFHLGHPTNMHNGFKLPVVISATCFTIRGIGEWWLKAGTPEAPKGVVGFYGTTTALMEADSLRSALARGSLDCMFTDTLATLGLAAEMGRLRYYTLYNDSLEYDSWTCLGDPALELWAASQKYFSVTHETHFEVGVCTLHVHVEHNSVPIDSARVCFRARRDTTLFKFTFTDPAGNAILIDTLNTAGDSLCVYVTKRTFVPYANSIFIAYHGSHVLMNSFDLLDSLGGNGDSIVNPGEDIEIDVCVKNWGDSTAYNVQGIVRNLGHNLYSVLHDTIKNFGDIPSMDSSSTSGDGFNITILPQCPDTTYISLVMILSNIDCRTENAYIDFYVHAPELSLYDYWFPGYVRNTAAGDSNDLTFEIHNSGSYQADSLVGQVLTSDTLITIFNPNVSFGTALPDSIVSNESSPVTIFVSASTPSGHEAMLELITTSGVTVDTFQCPILIGQRDCLVWDPDPNHSSGPVIKACLDSLRYINDYMTDFPHRLLSFYKCVFICVGMLPDKYVIKDTSSEVVDIVNYLMNANNKLYLEGGDVWFGDPVYHHGYDFSFLFKIDPLEDWLGTLNGVMGTDSSFSNGMSFTYSGQSSSVDHIIPKPYATEIFVKPSNHYGCGVAANHRTVGLSFEIGGLDNANPPSTRLALVDSIMNYFGVPPSGSKEMSSYTITHNLAFYPNPAMQSVCINFYGFKNERIRIEIYDVTGRQVNEFNVVPLDCSFHCNWDGRDSLNRKLPAGVYFIKVSTDNYTRTEKVVLLR